MKVSFKMLDFSSGRLYF